MIYYLPRQSRIGIAKKKFDCLFILIELFKIVPTYLFSYVLYKLHLPT